jgi:hypothetical protein
VSFPLRGIETSSSTSAVYPGGLEIVEVKGARHWLRIPAIQDAQIREVAAWLDARGVHGSQRPPRSPPLCRRCARLPRPSDPAARSDEAQVTLRAAIHWADALKHPVSYFEGEQVWLADVVAMQQLARPRRSDEVGLDQLAGVWDA